MSYLRQERDFSAPAVFHSINPNKQHNKAIYGTSETARNIPFTTVDFRSCRISAYISRLSQTAQQSQMRHILPTNIKTADMISSCLPSYFYQYHAVKPHCKAK